MNGDEHSNWDKLTVETCAHPAPITEERFRAWVGDRRIFVSSVMDSEMGPFREAVRAAIHRFGGSPVMWEELTPRDENPQRAYLSGVDSSTLFLVMLGSRYGVADSSGYSPTHQEANRARERRIPRLLFTLATVQDSERDGKLNDWLRSLHVEIAGASFDSDRDLVAQLEARLREIAARNERFWIKLGRLVFPGVVAANFQIGGEGTFAITARVQEGDVRRALLDLGRPFASGSHLQRLTWSNHSFPVQVKSVSLRSEFATEDVVEISCQTPANYGVSSSPFHTMLASFGNMSSAEVAVIWTRRAFFGETYKTTDRNRFDTAESFSEPDALTLPDILKSYQASDWLAEGLVRLYAVEEVSRRYNGQFQYLDVGPSTATDIKLAGSFTFNVGYGNASELVPFDGVVALSNS